MFTNAFKTSVLVDNKGINPQVAFLKFTYEEYSKLTEAPAMDTLMENILDKIHYWKFMHAEEEWTMYIS